jgi:hypothetical protein
MNQNQSKIVINLANQPKDEIYRISQMLIRIAKTLPTGKVLTVRHSPTFASKISADTH